MNRRLVLVTEIIAPYRIPVFNALALEPGIDLHVIFLAETDPTTRAWLVYKDEIRFSYEVLPSWRRRWRGRNFLLNWGVGAAMRRAQPQVIVCGGYNYLASWTLQSWARRHRVPFMLWAESTLKDRRRHRFLVELVKRKFMNRCDAFIVPGKSSFDYVRAFGVRAEDIYRAPNAVDSEFFSRHAEESRRQSDVHRKALALPERYLLFVGRLVREKGVFDLIEAYRALDPELRSRVGVVLVGDGAARAQLKELAASISPGQVQFPGFAQREQLATYYALAEAFIFPTHSDPWGLVVNEAMACGLPVVTTDAAGCCADLVEDGWNGSVIAAGNIEKLASAMKQLICQSELRSLMGQRSAARIENYSPQACAGGFVQAAVALGGQLHA